MKYSSSVNNYRETPYIVSDTFANKVNYAATIKGAIYVARDGASLNEPSIFQANGTIWVAIGGYGIGTDATLQDVTTNGKTTNQGITVTAGGVSTNTLTVTSLTPKSIPFVGTADLITEDNTNLVWDNVNKWIGIQTNVPTAEVDIHTTTATPAIIINNTAGLSSRIGFFNTDVNKWTIGNSAANAFNIYNPTLATNAISITGANNNSYFSGFVGINQAAPSYNLDVNGITNLGGVTNIQTGNNLFYLQNNGATTGWTANKAQNTGGSFIFGLNGSASGGISTGATAYSTVINSLKNLELYSGGVKRFTLDETTGDLTVGGNSYFATTSGNVGVGTNIATNKLSVADSNITDVTPDSGNLYVYTTGAVAANAGGKLMFGGTYTGTTRYGFAAISGRNSSGSAGVVNGYLSFVTHNNSTGDAERMRLTDLGNLLINSSIDDTVNKLQVNGNAKFSSSVTSQVILQGNSTNGSYVGDDVGGMYLWNISNTSLFLATNNTTRLQISGGGVVTIVNLAGTGSRAVLADANGTLSAPVSDQTIKENIQPLQYGLDTIMQLNPVQFEYIDSHKNYGKGLQIGNIAQDVEKIIPEAVFVTPSTGLKGIDYNQFNGIYIKAIQDQQKIIEGLIERIEQLENKY